MDCLRKITALLAVGETPKHFSSLVDLAREAKLSLLVNEFVFLGLYLDTQLIILFFVCSIEFICISLLVCAQGVITTTDFLLSIIFANTVPFLLPMGFRFFMFLES
jgi:hypothetical protein